MQRQVKQPKPSKNKIDKQQITDLLTQDSYYRKIRQWPLLSYKIQYNKPHRENEFDDMFITRRFNNRVPNNNFPNTIRNINDKHPHTTELLNKFRGHLIACGGAIAKAIVGVRGNLISDIDLFFYDLAIEEANKLRLDIIEFIINKFQHAKFNIQRNEFTTTIYVYIANKQRYPDYDSNYDNHDTYVYQLIHRIYPSIDSILGGFDLSSSMVAYDGNELLTTPLGYWSLENRAIIVDLTRRSTSFEHRLLKYYQLGFTIIFPGLSSLTVEENIIDPSNNLKTFLDKVKVLAAENGYIMAQNIDCCFIKSENNNIYKHQKLPDILPKFFINDGVNHDRRYYDAFEENDLTIRSIKIGKFPYDRENIEERYINKISDYASNDHFHSKYSYHVNASKLRAGNIDGVVSILEITDNYKNALIEDINHPNIGLTDNIINDYINRVQKLRDIIKVEKLLKDPQDDSNKLEIDHQTNLEFANFSKCFYKYTAEAMKNRNNDKYNEYRDLMISTMIKNEEICKKKLTGIKWIVNNPGRQWTSSINPIIEDPRKWYGQHYIPVLTGIPIEIETCLRLARLRSIWSLLPDDVFNLIMLCIMKNNADRAWKHIL